MLDMKNVMPELMLAELKSYVYLYNTSLPQDYIEERLLKGVVVGAAHPGVVIPSSTTTPKLSSAASAARKKKPSHSRGKSIALPADMEQELLEQQQQQQQPQQHDHDESPPDRSTDVLAYLSYVVRSLAILDKALSSQNELALTADSAHRRLIESEIASHQKKASIATTTTTTMRHGVCVRHPEVRRSHKWMGDAMKSVCDKLAVVMMHHMALVTPTGKYTAAHQWGSIQRVLVELLERYVIPSEQQQQQQLHDEQHETPPSASSVAMDGFFRFSASAAMSDLASRTPAASSSTSFHWSPSSEEAMPWSPSHEIVMAPPMAEASPLLLSAIQVPLVTLMSRVKTHCGGLESEILSLFLQRCVVGSYIPLLRAEYTRLLIASFPTGVVGLISAATEDLANDAQEAPGKLAGEFGLLLSNDLYGVVVGQR